MHPFRARRGYSSIGFLILGSIAACIAVARAELRLVNVVFRHGDRTPDKGNEMYPNDPHLDSDFYPMGLGQLTNIGKKREFDLGGYLRRNYGTFLGEVYTPSILSALSSDYDRTKASLQLVLAALFPPAPIQRWNQELPWQPIAAQYIPRLRDNVFLADECPAYLREYAKVLDSPEARKELAKFSDLTKNLTIWTGKNVTTPSDLYYLYHTFVSEASMNLTLPDWVHTVFPRGRLWDATIFSYHVSNANTRLRRLFAGPLLRRMRESMLAAKDGSLAEGRKLYLYSGHESNVAALLKALRVYEPRVPEYSSAIILELWREEDYYVKILHYLGIPPVARELRLPGCDVLCPLEQFLELTASVTASSEDLSCDKTLTEAYALRADRATMEKSLHATIADYADEETD